MLRDGDDIDGLDDIKHYILIKNIKKFINDNSHVIKTCRNFLNVFYSDLKYKNHIEYCNFIKSKKLMSPFKKYMQFENLKICILNNQFIQILNVLLILLQKNMNIFLVDIIWNVEIINFLKKFKRFMI